MTAGGPIGGGARFLKLASMTARVAGDYAATKVKAAFQNAEVAAIAQAAAHQIAGERIAKTLGELKGAVMKVGQMASIASDVLPKEIAEALQVLQKEAPPMPYTVIAEQIQRELGSAPETLFKRFEPAPFAAASIGQVHRATTDDGREVVVKVQYPGVDRSVDSDLAHLKIALRASGLARIDKRALDSVFEELRDRLHEELDYTNEADNVRLFRKIHAEHPFVVIPEVVGERSSGRVLTLTYEQGDTISQLDSLGYPQEIRDRIGERMLLAFCHQLFAEPHAIHGDPNPANLAFRPDGTIVLYDFGCVKRVPIEVVNTYGGTVKAGIEEDYASVARGLVALGARLPEVAPLGRDFYKPWRDLLFAPVLAERFDYGASTIQDGVVRLVPGALTTLLTAFKPPAQLILIDRVIVGHYGNLRRIRARCHAKAIVDGFLAGMKKP